MSESSLMESAGTAREPSERINLVKSIPFALMHLMPLGIFYFGFNWRDFALCIALYVVRMFFITGAYHRYFSHRSYKVGRFMQFLLAFGGATAAQKGPLWWASHHRVHHKYSDTPQDVHPPSRGFWWAHVGWILCSKYEDTDLNRVKDLAKYPELRWLDKHYLVPPTILALSVFALGGASALFTGFFLSTVLLYHGTFTINSLTHRFGKRRYATTDTSKNSLLLALITLGEGWHNNHHYYQGSANQGFFWWEIDISYYTLVVLSWFGLVRDLRKPPQKVLTSNLVKDVGDTALDTRNKSGTEAALGTTEGGRIHERPATNHVSQPVAL
ncbi:MAG: acyl-CoA desaturase [Polyangiaceae bacterium]